MRGVLAVPLGRTTDVGGYTVQSGTVGNGTFAPNRRVEEPGRGFECDSTATGFDNDIDAFNNGFITSPTSTPISGDR